MRLPTFRLAKSLCFFALAVMTVVALSPAPAAAETSYKKLKKKLRNFEWHAGEAFKGLGSAMVEILDHMEWDDAESCAADLAPFPKAHAPAPPPRPPEKPKAKPASNPPSTHSPGGRWEP